MTHFVWLKGVIYTRDIMNAREIKKLNLGIML